MFGGRIGENEFEILNIAKDLENNTFRKIIEIYRKNHENAIEFDVDEDFSYNLEDKIFLKNVKDKSNTKKLIENYFSCREIDLLKSQIEIILVPFESTNDYDIQLDKNLFISMTPLSDLKTDFLDSQLYEKMKKCLIIFYKCDKSKNPMDYVIEYVDFLSPIEKDLVCLKSDYEKIKEKMVSGNINELKEKDTMYLGVISDIITFEENHKDKCDKSTEDKNIYYFSLKNSYINSILNNHIFKDKSNIKNSHHYNTIESQFKERLNKYKNKTDKELCLIFGESYDNKKSLWSDLTYKMLDIKQNEADELKKEGFAIKTIRLDKKRVIKENILLSPLKFKELVLEEWENSKFRKCFKNTKFLFVIFLESGDFYQFIDFKFWSMPNHDLEHIAKDEWYKIRNKIKDGIKFFVDGNTVKNDLPKKSDNSILHIRPHARNRAYRLNNYTTGDIKDADELPNGEWMTRQSFWLNNNYLLDQLFGKNEDLINNLVYMFVEKEDNSIIEYKNKNYNIKIEKKDDIKNFKIDKKNDSIYSFKKINDSFLLLGKNGSGKTTFLRALFNQRTRSYSGENIDKRFKSIFSIYENNNNYYLCKPIDKNTSEKKVLINGMAWKQVEDIKFVFIFKDICQYRIEFSSILHKGTDFKYLDTEALRFLKQNLESKNTILSFDYNKKIYLKTKYDIENFQNIYTYFFERIHLKKQLSVKMKFFIKMLLYTLSDTNTKIENNDVFSLVQEKFKLFDENKINEITLIKEIIKCLEKKYIYNFEEKSINILEAIETMSFVEYENNTGRLYFLYSSLEVENNYNLLFNFLNTFEHCFTLDIYGSTGEKAMIELIASLNTAINIIDKQYKKPIICYLLLDELEQNLHPEWCRLIYSKITDAINNSETKHKFYIFMSTHSPYIVSDFTYDNIINFDENVDNMGIPFHTFGANIHEILSKGMFLKESMGKFALDNIREVHKQLSIKGNTKENIFKELKMMTNIKHDENYLKNCENKLLYFIDNIGEPLIKIQLKHLWNEIDNNTLYSLEDLKNKSNEELINIIRGVCDVKD